jgi:ABC-type spermidine/putrescine transport system permease subunit II
MDKLVGMAKANIVNEDEKVNILEKIKIFLIMAAMTLPIFILAAVGFLIHKFRNKIKEKVKALKEKMIWNGLLRSFVVAYFGSMMSIGGQVKLLVKESPFL